MRFRASRLLWAGEGENTSKGYRVTNVDHPMPDDDTIFKNRFHHKDFHRYGDDAAGQAAKVDLDSLCATSLRGSRRISQRYGYRSPTAVIPQAGMVAMGRIWARR